MNEGSEASPRPGCEAVEEARSRYWLCLQSAAEAAITKTENNDFTDQRNTVRNSPLVPLCKRLAKRLSAFPEWYGSRTRYIQSNSLVLYPLS